jgi:hypothetical protein
VRAKIHSSRGGRKAHLNSELKDAPKARGLRPSQILDFKVQIRSGQPCDEWEDVAGAAVVLIDGATGVRPKGPFLGTRQLSRVPGRR